jgi:hypothetical protein
MTELNLNKMITEGEYYLNLKEVINYVNTNFSKSSRKSIIVSDKETSGSLLIDTKR